MASNIPLFVVDAENLKLRKDSVVENADAAKLKAVLKGATHTTKWMEPVNTATGGACDIIVRKVRIDEEAEPVLTGLDNTRRAWRVQTTLVKEFAVDGVAYQMYRLKGGHRPAIEAGF